MRQPPFTAPKTENRYFSLVIFSRLFPKCCRIFNHLSTAVYAAICFLWKYASKLSFPYIEKSQVWFCMKSHFNDSLDPRNSPNRDSSAFAKISNFLSFIAKKFTESNDFLKWNTFFYRFYRFYEFFASNYYGPKYRFSSGFRHRI